MTKFTLTDDKGVEQTLDVTAGGSDDEYYRVSQSPLWNAMADLYKKQGLALWDDMLIPSAPSTNSFIAHAYAEVVQTFFQECNKARKKEPAYIVELGAGSGRLAFHFLQHFFGDDVANPMVENVVYVMTDISKANIKAWRKRPQFKPFIKAGLLDFALYDAAVDEEISLMQAKVTLRAGSLKRPIVMLANYVLDSLPSDIFEMRDGQLSEKRVRVEPHALDNLTGEGIAATSFQYKARPIDLPYYDDPALDALLERYVDRPETFQFTLPLGGLRVISSVAALTAGPMLTLVSDYGPVNKVAVSRIAHLAINNHGAGSIDVNFDAIRAFMEAEDGEVLQFDGAYSSIATVGYLSGLKTATAVRTKQAYADRVGTFGPDDYFAIYKALKEKETGLGFREIIAHIRLSKYDSLMFLLWRAPLIEAAIAARDDENPLLRETLLSLADNMARFCYYFELETGVALALAQIYIPLGEIKKARRLLKAVRAAQSDPTNVDTLLVRCDKAEGK